MSDRILLNACKGKPKALSLCNKKLDKVPSIIGTITSLKSIDLKSNQLKSLPKEFATLNKLETLNLGDNRLEEIPEVLFYLENLQKLHLFKNLLKELNSPVLAGLQMLTFLNLNGNQLTSLPPDINRLVSLQFLSLNSNQLTSIPTEICHLINLTELHIADNQITSLPEDFAFLRNLAKLYAQKNYIEELPEVRMTHISDKIVCIAYSNQFILFPNSLGGNKGLTKCSRLETLDISANRLRIFPAELSHLPLKELYCEENSLLRHIPVHSQQEDEVLTLKEITARFVLKGLKDGHSYIRLTIRHYPKIQEMLQYSSQCAVCDVSFLNTWLECVHFVDAKKSLKTKTSTRIIPIRGLLCSYKCFNSEGHDYFGIAHVEDR